MPVGGRINRRDNLRSKKALTKTQSSKDITSTSKLSKTNEKESHDPEILEAPSNSNSNFVNVVKSDNITKGIRNIYVCLEDIKFSNKTKIDEFLIENIENNELDKISVVEDKQENKTSSRRTTGLRRKLLDPAVNFIDEHFEEPKKKSIKEIKDEVLLNKDKSDIVDKTKKEGKNNRLNKRKGRGAAQIDELSLDSVSVDQKTDSPKSLKEVISETPQKSTKISKKEKNDIMNKVTEMFLDDIATKVKLRKRNATLEKSVEVSNLAKITSIDKQELISPSNCSDIKNTQEENNLSNIPPKAKEESAPTRLGRRSAFQRNLETKLECAKVIKQKINIVDDLDKDSKENASTDSSIPILTSVEHSVEIPLKPEVVLKRTIKREYPKSNISEPIKSVDPVSNRLDSMNRPFVVERDETKDENVHNVVKIPGLIMLDNIKKRKSMMINSKPVIVKEKNSQNPDIPAENLEEKPIEKSTNKTKKSIVDKQIEKTMEYGDSDEGKCLTLDQKEVPDKKQEVISEIPKIDRTSPPENQKKTPGRPKKIVEVKDTVPTDTEEKIPGLRMIADIRRRKSEMQAASNNLKKLSSKINIRRSNAPGDKEHILDQNDKGDIKTNKQIVSTAYSPTEKKPDVTSKLSEDRKTGKHDNAPKDEEKVPGLATIKELKEMKMVRSSIHLTNLEKSSEKLKKSEKHVHTKRSMTSDKVPGLSTINKLKRQHEIQVQEAQSSNENTNNALNAHPVPMECSSSVADVPSFSNPVLLTPLSAKFQSMKDYKPRASILSKPSPYKRPMLDQATDVMGSVAKMPRLQIERRQSVTFNKEVEVKEIHGNSFNSLTDEGSVIESVNTSKTLEQQLSSELERTKNRLADKRSRNVNVSFSSMPHTSLGPSVFPKSDMRSLTKKNSDLSQLISARIKVQSNVSASPLSQAPFTSQSSTVRKFATLPISSTHRDMSQSWKSFKQNPVSGASENSDDESIGSLNQSGEENDKSAKGRCLVM